MLEKWIEILHYTFIAFIGGCISYLSNTKDFSLKEFLIKGISSGFTGYLIYQLCIYGNIPDSMTAFLCGSFGYLGSEVTINVIKRFVTSKINLLK